MSFTHEIVRTWRSGALEVSQSLSISGDAEDNRDLVIPDSTTDQLVTMSIDVSLLKVLYIESDQTITIETNDGAAPDDTLVITANEPLVWTPNCGYTNPLGTDVTKLYVTNSSGSEANVKIRVLQDSTP